MIDDRGDSGAAAPGRVEYSLVLSVRAMAALAAATVATLLAATLIDRAGEALSLLAIAVTGAILIAPAVRLMSRWMPRTAAIVIVAIGGMVLVMAALAVVAWDLNRHAGSLSAALQEAIDRLPRDGGAAQFADKLDLSQHIDDLLDGLGLRAVFGTDDPVAVAGLAGRVVVIGVLVAFMAAGGQSLVERAVHLVRRTSTRQALHEALGVAANRGGAFTRRTLAVSAAHGLFAGLVCAYLDLPGAVSLGAWVAVVSTVPIFGGFIAWAPIVALASLAHHSLAGAVAAAIVGVVGDRCARHWWVHRALHVGSLISLAGIAIGFTILGVPGAIVGVWVAAALFAVGTRAGGSTSAAIAKLVEDGSAPEVARDSTVVEPEAAPVIADALPREHLVRVRVSRRTLGSMAVLVVLAWTVVLVARQTSSVLVWVVIGTLIGIGLDRPVAAMCRSWHVPRPAGIALVAGVLVGLAVAVAVLGGPSVTSSAGSIADDAPELVQSLEKLPFLGRLIDGDEASANVEQWVRDLPDRLADSGLVSSVASTAGDVVVGTLWTLGFVLAVLFDGPRLADLVRAQVPVRSRRRAVRLGNAAYRAVSNVAAAAAFVAVLNGTVVMLLALALDIPVAPVLGVWAAAWNFIPQVGGFVGGAPLVALAFTQGVWPGAIALLAFIGYQTFENHVIQPIVGAKAIDLPPLVLLIGALLGGALAGFVGAVVAGPVMGVARATMNELGDGDDYRIEDRDPPLTS